MVLPRPGALHALQVTEDKDASAIEAPDALSAALTQSPLVAVGRYARPLGKETTSAPPICPFTAIGETIAPNYAPRYWSYVLELPKGKTPPER